MEVIVMLKVEIDPERDHFQETMVATELGVQAIVDQGPDPELVQTGIE